MPIDVRRIRTLVAYNRRDILAVDEYFAHKIGALTRYLYFYLEREGRARDAKRLRGMDTPGRIAWLRPRVESLPERSQFYARSIIEEEDASTEIRLLDLGLPKVKEPVELLRRVIELKFREADFLRDLLRSIIAYLPTQTRWVTEVERVLGLVTRRLDGLYAMVGSLEGRVFDEVTKEPIESAEVELIPLAGGTALSAVTDKMGRYKIVFIPPGDYRALCRAEGYEEAEDTFAIVGGEVRRKDWFLKPVAVPEVWEYTLRVSARVVSGYAPGSVHPRKPPRQVTLTGEPADLPDLKMGRKVKERSPIFAELFFESFISSLDEVHLEDRYRQPLINIVEAIKGKIARYANMVSIDLGEWDFGIESKKVIEPERLEKLKESLKLGTPEEKEASDFYEVALYFPSGFSYVVEENYFGHEV